MEPEASQHRLLCDVESVDIRTRGPTQGRGGGEGSAGLSDGEVGSGYAAGISLTVHLDELLCRERLAVDWVCEVGMQGVMMTL